MGKMKDLRDITIVGLSLCTAFGLGILTGVCAETKILIDVFHDCTNRNNSHTSKEEA